MLETLDAIVTFKLYNASLLLYRREHGVLTTRFSGSELKPYEGMPDFQCISDLNAISTTLSLREAARSSSKEVKCHCSKSRTCSTKRCPCKKAGISCSSHCHHGNFSCTNSTKEIDVKMISSEGKL